MHPEELHSLLHRALETWVEKILQLTTSAGWLDDADAVHDARVASRRLRTVLDLADPERYPALRKQRKRAKAITEALGIVVEHRRGAFEALPQAAEPMDPARAIEELFQDQGGVPA